MLVFMDPWFLLLAASVPLWLWGRRTFLKPASIGFSSEVLVRPVAGKARARLLFLPVSLQALGMLLLVAALARPMAEEDDASYFTEGIDIFLCLDLSSSMSENVLDANRSNLDVASQVVRDFIKSRGQHPTGHDRMGLITFARFPELVCPLTTDIETLCGFIDQCETVPQGAEKDGTGLGAALAEAARRFEDSKKTDRYGSDQRSREKVIVLLTDGEENQHIIDPMTAANFCADLHARVYPVAAAGTAGQERKAVAPDSAPVHGLLDVARITGGLFSRATTGDDLKQVYKEIDLLETKPVELKHIVLRTELYHGFLIAAMVLLFVAFVLDRTVFLRIP